MKIPNAKAAVDNEWEKLQKLPANDLGEAKKRRLFFWKHKHKKCKEPFSKKFGV